MGKRLVTGLVAAVAASLSLTAVGHTGAVQLAPGVTMPSLAQRASSARHPALSSQARAALPTATRTALIRAAVQPTLPPVLLVDDVGLLRTAETVVGPTWHAVSMTGPDYSVYIHASAAALHVPGVRRPPVRTPSLAVPRVSRTHEIVTAHFVAWGVAWDVDIECLGGIDHPLCGDDVLIHALLKSLRRLEPRP